MNITGIPSPLIVRGDHIGEVLLTALEKNKEHVEEHTIFVITSKVISVAEGSIRTGKTFQDLKKIIYSEADEVLGKSEKYDFFLTRKDGFLMPNAGIDTSNAEQGTAILLPNTPQESANTIREYICRITRKKNIGIIICDSRVIPFRRGISGVALAWSGFIGITDERGKHDIYGSPLQVSEIAVADNISSIAQIFFGQAGEKIPFVMCKTPPVTFTDTPQESKQACIPPEEDLFSDFFPQKKVAV